jgi:hypothetical protein
LNDVNILENRKRCSYPGCPWFLKVNENCPAHSPPIESEHWPFNDPAVKWLYHQEIRRGWKKHGNPIRNWGYQRRPRLALGKGNYKSPRIAGAE